MITLRVPGDHPSLPGHFPGQPVVPGVVLLDEICAALALTPRALGAVKFFAPIQSDQEITLSWEAGGFTAHQEGRKLASGRIQS